jgi:dienelactone hydrolase
VSISSAPLSYSDLDTPLTGFIFRNAAPGHRPGLLLIHGATGLDDHARGQARRYAELGYVVLACDMFGPGVAGDRQRVVSLLTALRDDPQRLARRARAGLDQAGADWQVSMYGGASHGFTHADAVPGAIPGVAYHAAADQCSFALTRAFLAEAFAGVGGPA